MFRVVLGVMLNSDLLGGGSSHEGPSLSRVAQDFIAVIEPLASEYEKMVALPCRETGEEGPLVAHCDYLQVTSCIAHVS